MNNTTIYVGMDVHKESFSLSAYTIGAEKESITIVTIVWSVILKVSKNSWN
ncbi:MAG: hypothetical protein K5769_03740 [Pseudobutyrivibrio sp.]|nr:hypothetical protein [Pseudobutyrivibrio sp.]